MDFKKFIKDLYFILVILYSGLATYLYRSLEGFILLFLVGIVIHLNRFLQPTKRVFLALAIWAGYFALSTLIMQSFHPHFFSTYIVKIIIAWLLISYYGDMIFEKYENVLYYLSAFSLFFWVWQTLDYYSLNEIMTYLDVSGKSLSTEFGINSRNIFVYTIGSRYVPGEIPRNCGFTWEPGPFSAYVIIAIFINIARTNFRIVGNRRLLVFIITLITTFSTTGFIGLLAIILWVSYNIFKKQYVFLGLPLALGLVVYLFISVPFLQEKIIEESSQDIDEAISRSRRLGIAIDPGRFASFQLGWKDFKNYPLTGFGGHVEARYATQQGAEVSTINGFANIMSRYGLFGLSIFLFLIIATGKWLAFYYEYRFFWIFPALFLIISFSFGIVESFINFTLWIFYFFNPKRSFFNK
jgi:hypothetical protein